MGNDLKHQAAAVLKEVRSVAGGLAADIRELATDRSPLAHDLSVLATELRKCALMAQGIKMAHAEQAEAVE